MGKIKSFDAFLFIKISSKLQKLLKVVKAFVRFLFCKLLMEPESFISGLNYFLVFSKLVCQKFHRKLSKVFLDHRKLFKISKVKKLSN